MERVAAYCRVSTDSDDQVHSLTGQENYFREYIDSNPEWEPAGIFIDTGITGTSTKKRAAFNRMIEEAMAGSFDLILTKEISRFARNTLDSIYYTRKLKEHGIGVIFINDNINTLDADAELRLTIMSSIAQEESRKTSERVKWGQRRSMEQGVVFGRDMLGYDVHNGRLYINEEGAKIVRMIFHKFVNEGKGTHVIARELQEAGIKTSAHMRQWSNTAILRCLRNEKFCGDLIQKKTYTPSYLTHEKKYNRGQESFVVLHNHHEAIISRELFDCAQRELERRVPSPEQNAKYSNRYCFSGKIKCKSCGSSLVSRTRKRKNGSVYRTWRCYEAVRHGSKHMDADGVEIGCNCSSISDEDLKLILQSVMKSLLSDQSVLIKKIGDTVDKMLQSGCREPDGECIRQRAEILAQKKIRLIELFLAQEISEQEFKQLQEKHESEMTVLEQEQKQSNESALTVAQNAIHQEIKQQINALMTGRSWDDTFYRNMLESVTVEENHTVTISLKGIPCQWHAVLKKEQALPDAKPVPETIA